MIFCMWLKGIFKEKVTKISKENIRFFDFLEPKEVMNLVSKAQAFLHAGIEDFE